ncbi:BolA family transcriptional regulator [Silanimonas algicola]
MSAPVIEGGLPREARGAEIEARLRTALQPQSLEVIDDSHKHRGHAGAADGRSHFSVRIVADAFAGLRPIARHRLVYEALGSLMATDIHALAIEARAPGEAGP